MGSHTTAWVVEVEALKCLVAREDDPASALWNAVRADLKSKVTGLDIYLPADQLAAGQLIALFDAAQAVETAEHLADKARCFLQFRNLLPFATVDAGNRAGKGERRNAQLWETFDIDSLKEAAELQQSAYQTQLEDSARALEDAAGVLGALIPRELPKRGKKKSEVSEEDEERWPSDAVRAAAKESYLRMRAFAKTLTFPTDLDVPKVIIPIRRIEHERVYAESGMPK